MKRIIILIYLVCFLSIISAKEMLQIELCAPPFLNSEMYIELKYDVENSVYVSDELTTGSFMYQRKENKIEAYYYPRGNTIIRGNERTFWSALVRKINPGETLAIRVVMNQIIKDVNEMYIGENIVVEEVDLIICDFYYVLESKRNQTRLFPENIILQESLMSEVIKLRYDSTGYWFMLE